MSGAVVVTGIGAVCAAGGSPEAIFAALAARRSAIAPLRGLAAAGPDVPPGGEIEGFDPAALVPDRKVHKFLRRGDFLGLNAAAQAVRAAALLEHRAGLSPDARADFDERSGIFVGSGGVGYEHQYDFLPLLTKAGGDLGRFGAELRATVSPLWLLQSLPNNVLCHLGIQTGFKGANACITTHGASSALAILEALAAIRSGEVDRAVVVGHDAPLAPQAIRELRALGLLAREAVRPFDARRDGTLLGEGAAALVLESASSARARGAPAQAEVLGGACRGEAQGLLPVREDGAGPAGAIAAALGDARLAADRIGMIVAHGNGTPLGDRSEAAAIDACFGGAAPPVTAFKWAFGHTLAAAGALETTLAILALRARRVPGIATLRERDPGLSRLPVSPEPTAPRGDAALVLTRGFAGVDVALAVRAPAPGG
jgi:3-oxoacyl-[acyl-carrier-protein] synthase-1